MLAKNQDLATITPSVSHTLCRLNTPIKGTYLSKAKLTFYYILFSSLI